MNKKITFPRLSAMLADKSGRSKRFSEDFLREFFSLISERLEAGESVKIKGFGTFRLSRVEPRKSVDVTTGEAMEISGHSKVVFVPAKELASAVNSPFEAFTAIEISDDADISQLFDEEEIKKLNIAEDTSESEIPVSEELADTLQHDMGQQDAGIPEKDEFVIVTPATEDKETVNMATEPSKPSDSKTETPAMSDKETQVSFDSQDNESKEEENLTESEVNDLNDEPKNTYDNEEQEYSDEIPERKSKWKKRLLISFAAAICAIFATIAIWYVFATNDFNGILNRSASISKTDTSKVNHPTVADANYEAPSENSLMTTEDSISDSANEIEEESEVPTAPSDPIVYDTISTTRYLTTMAKAHYGNYNLWPFIYEENKAKLGHPDRIRPGTPVVIPKLSKYGIDASRPEDVDKAKKMGVEIYARYGKSI
ncbi:MAG: HU family DNA-binding protein [Muribaculaceae bacterium]|nr:HU family DNA-binding protein [Muribaculaceae bacterium]